jgi:hypothetical protein
MHVSTIRDTLHKQPFQSFTLRLVDGREYPVPHPDFVAISDRAVVIMGVDNDAITVLEPGLIISLEGMKSSPPAAKPPGAN